MAAFAQAKIEQRDASIEEYLLNNWTAVLSSRDVVDRVAYTLKEEVELVLGFVPMMSWLLEKLQDWVLEDFRKLATTLA